MIVLLTPRSLFASCASWTGQGSGSANPAAQAAMFTTLGIIAVVLGGCVAFGIMLYRRSIARRLPHHDLIEELENYGAETIAQGTESI